MLLVEKVRIAKTDCSLSDGVLLLSKSLMTKYQYHMSQLSLCWFIPTSSWLYADVINVIKSLEHRLLLHERG